MFHQHRQAINVPPNRLLIRLPIQQLLLENFFTVSKKYQSVRLNFSKQLFVWKNEFKPTVETIIF